METTETALVQYSWLELTGEEPIREANQLPAQQLETLSNIFAPYMQQVLQMEQMAYEVEVTDEDDREGMAKAKRLRIQIKNIRTEVEKIRKEEKQYSLITGRVVDYFGKTIRERAEILENRLKEHEEYAERKAAERRELLRKERDALLSPYVESTLHFDLGTMSERGFEELLQSSRMAHEARVKEQWEAEEAERLRIEAEKAERERLAAENERLQAELRAKQEAEEAAAQAEREAQALAATASDKDKLLVLYRTIEAIQIPEMQNGWGGIGRMVEARLKDTLDIIKREAKKLDQ